MSQAPPLSQGAGYGVVIGLGALFAIVSELSSVEFVHFIWADNGTCII